MKLPGVAWTALTLALTAALGGWLTDYVQTPWVPIAVLALNLIAKAAEIYFAQPKTEVLASSISQRSPLSQLFLG